MIKKSLTGYLSFIYSKNTTTPGAKVKLTEEIPVEVQYEEDGLRTQSVSLMIRKSDKSSVRSSGPENESGIY